MEEIMPFDADEAPVTIYDDPEFRELALEAGLNLEDELAVNDAGDAHRIMKMIGAIDRAIEREELDRKEEVEMVNRFRAQRTEAKLKQRDWLEAKLEAYVHARGESYSGPAGKAYFRTTVQKSWAPDERLLRFAKAHGIPYRTEERPLKREIEEYIAEHGLADDEEGPVLEREAHRKFYVTPTRRS